MTEQALTKKELTITLNDVQDKINSSEDIGRVQSLLLSGILGLQHDLCCHAIDLNEKMDKLISIFEKSEEEKS